MEKEEISYDPEYVVRLYSKTVYGIALTHTLSKTDADDIFQEVFMIYLSKKPVFNEEEHRKAWLINTAMNCCKRYNSKLAKAPASLECIEDLAERLETNDQREVYEAVLSLPDKYKAVIYLFYFEDLTAKEIAKVLKIRENAVFTRLSRGRDMLKEKLKDSYS